MSERIQLISWPGADARDTVLFFAIGLFFFALAAITELHRRRRDRKERLAFERRQANDLFDERDLQGEDRTLALSIIDQYAARQPYRFATRRHTFDDCMDQYFQALAAKADAGTLAQRGTQLRDIRTRLGLDYVPLGQRILSTRELYDGQVLWASPASGRDARWFHLKTTSVDEAFFHVVPAGADGAPDFQPGDTVKFRLWREDDARYHFVARIYQVDREPPGWRVQHANKLTRSQARAHYRLRFDETVQVSILNATLGDRVEGLLEIPPVTQLQGRITSLSGGGMAIHFQQPMPKQMVMRVPLRLPDTDRSVVTLVRPTGAQNVGGGCSVVRGKFAGMDEETRDLITRYIFLKQKQSAGDESYSG